LRRIKLEEKARNICDGIPSGFYCTNDLTGYHYCDDNSVMTTKQCGSTTRCSCQFNMICKAEEKNICTEYSTLHFTPNLIIGYVGTRYIEVPHEYNMTNNIAYLIRQDALDEHYYQRNFFENKVQEISLIARDPKDKTLYEYIRYYQNSAQVSCEKLAAQNFVTFGDHYKYYSLSKHPEIIPTDFRFANSPFSYKEEWTLKIGRLFPHQQSVHRYLIIDVEKHTGIRKPVYFVERTYGSTSEEIFTETKLQVSIYSETASGSAWFRAPHSCEEPIF